MLVSRADPVRLFLCYLTLFDAYDPKILFILQIPVQNGHCYTSSSKRSARVTIYRNEDQHPCYSELSPHRQDKYYDVYSVNYACPSLPIDIDAPILSDNYVPWPCWLNRFLSGGWFKLGNPLLINLGTQRCVHRYALLMCKHCVTSASFSNHNHHSVIRMNFRSLGIFEQHPVNTLLLKYI